MLLALAGRDNTIRGNTFLPSRMGTSISSMPCNGSSVADKSPFNAPGFCRRGVTDGHQIRSALKRPNVCFLFIDFTLILSTSRMGHPGRELPGFCSEVEPPLQDPARIWRLYGEDCSIFWACTAIYTHRLMPQKRLCRAIWRCLALISFRQEES